MSLPLAPINASRGHESLRSAATRFARSAGWRAYSWRTADQPVIPLLQSRGYTAAEAVARAIRPGFTFRFRQQTRTFDLDAYHTGHARDLSAATEIYAASACRRASRCVSGIRHVDAIDVAVEGEARLVVVVL